MFGKDCKDGIEKLIQDALYKPIMLCPKGMPYKFSPIHIDDVTKLLYQYIFTDFESNSIKNINGNEKYSFKDVLHLVKKHKKLSILYLNRTFVFMFLKFVNLVPFYFGIIPDQIERLYGHKSYSLISSIHENLYTVENYIKDTLKK